MSQFYQRDSSAVRYNRRGCFKREARHGDGSHGREGYKEIAVSTMVEVLE
jgi:hypothetical protein